MNVLAIPGAIVRTTVGLTVQSAEAVVNLIPGVKRKDLKNHGGDLNVFQMADPMLDMSSLIYVIAELRRIARVQIKELREELKLNQKQMKVLLNAIDTKRQALKDIENGGKDSSKFQQSIQGLKDIEKRFNLSSGHIQTFETFTDILVLPKTSAETLSDLRVYAPYMKPFLLGFGGEDFNIELLESLVASAFDKGDAEIVFFDDDFDTLLGFGSECCYAIAVSRRLKTITVIFRGSVRPQDFVTDLTLVSTELRLPGFTGHETGYDGGKEDRRKTFGSIHKGFNEFLFGETKRGSDERIISKAEEIMGQLTSMLKEEFKGYDVYFTGHSLGAALSTLMAFRAVALGEIKHVKNVSFASPFVGDQEFRNLFEEQEMKGAIQHLRISNDEDIVPLVPWSSPTMPPKSYKHVGVNVKLYDESLLTPKYRVFYPKKGDLLNEVRNAVHTNVLLGFTISFIPKHLCPEYRERLDNAKEDLEKISLASIYNDSDITGWELITRDPEVVLW